MKPVKIAQIGTGHDHAPAIWAEINALDCFDCIGLCEPVEEYQNRPFENAAYKGAKLWKLEDLLQNPDLEAVTIETGKEYSTYYAQLFADRGVHIYLDKPGTADLSTYEHLVRTCERKGIVFHMGYMYRYNPLIRRCFEMAQEGKFGEIYSVEAQMSVRHLPDKRQWLARYKGGMMYYLGCHLIDLVYTLQGEPEEVLPMNTCVRSDGITAEDFGFSVLKYPHGVSFIKTSGAEYNGYHRRQLVISGTRGTVELRPLEYFVSGGIRTTGLITLEDFAPNHWKNDAHYLSSAPFDRYEAMLRGFAAIVRGERENPYTPDYEIGLMRLLLKCCGVQ